MTLKDLLEKLKEQNAQAISAEIYTLYRGKCIYWLLKQGNTHDINHAKDIYTDAVLILLDNAQRNKIIASDTQVLTYLITTCRNIQSNLNKRKDKPSEWEFDDLIESLSDENPETVIEKEALLVRIEDTLKLLKDPCSTLFQLYYFEDNSHRTIAQKLGYASESVAKSMLYKCKKNFEKLFGNLF